MSEITAGIFIINDKNQILLTHATHSARKFWGIPKGLVNKDSGETTLDAAVREVAEETGIKILETSAVKPLGTSKYKGVSKTLVAYYVFLEDLSANGLIIEGKDGVYVMGCDSSHKARLDPDSKGLIKNIDPSLLWCRSMVEPRKEGELPFPEVDKAEPLLYKPQKEVLPCLLELLRFA
jgi:ADP-ribose pyrophosphatase YjhB (NUDIX family)